MKEIVCNMGQFTLNHPIYLYNGTQSKLLKSVPTDEIVYELYAAAIEYNVFHFHLFGNMDYITVYGEALTSKIAHEYSNQNFEIIYN